MEITRSKASWNSSGSTWQNWSLEMLEDYPLSSSVELFFCWNLWIYGHYRCINETFATSPVMTLRLVSPLSLACSSIYSLCWFELDRALTLLPGNLSKDNVSKLKVWWIYVKEKSSHASWVIKSTWLPWRGQQSPIHNRGQGGPFHPLVTLTKLKVHASMFSGASEERKKQEVFAFFKLTSADLYPQRWWRWHFWWQTHCQE